jgi:tetratricopeptide (TPR) repeat protein
LEVSDLQFELDQLDYDRCPDTGIWLLKHQAFIDFVNCIDSASFHLCGNPGSGKTFLVSKVIDELRKCTIGTPTIAVIYVLCDGKTDASNRRTSLAALKTLTAQLLETIATIDPSFVNTNLEALRMVKQKAKHIPEGQLFKVLQKCLLCFEMCYIVIDAVDECDDWRNLFQILIRLIDTKVCTLKFFLSSQKGMGIPYVISRLPVLNSYRVNVTAHKVQSDIEQYVDWRIRTLDVRNLGSPVEARESLLHGCDGLFLLIRLRLDILTKEILPLGAGTRTVLSELPSEIFPLYERLLDRLDHAHKSLAQILFMWVIHAQRVLTLQELAEAYRIELEDTDTASNLSESEIEGLSGGLIEVYKGRVRLAHTSVRDFATLYRWGKQARVNHMAQDIINRRVLSKCLGYIATKSLVSEIMSTCELPENFRIRWPLADYAGHNWLAHLRLCSTGSKELSKQIVDFIQSDAGLAWWMCYTTHIEVHNWWSIPEISADITAWLHNNYESYHTVSDTIDIVFALCDRHVSVLKHYKPQLRLDSYIPALLRLAGQKVEYGYTTEAETLLKLVIDKCDAMSSASAELAKYQAMLHLASVLSCKGRFHEALRLCEEVQSDLQKNGENCNRQMISTLQTIGLITRESGQIAISEQLLRNLLDTTQHRLGRNDPDTLAVAHALAFTCFHQGKYKEAGSLWDIQYYKTVLGKDHPSTLTVMECVADLLRVQGKLGEASELRIEVLQLRRVRQSAQAMDTITTQRNFAYCLRDQGKVADGIVILQQQIEMNVERLSHDQFPLLWLKSALAELFLGAGDHSRAETLQLYVVEEMVRRLGGRHIWTLNEKTRLSAINLSQGRYEMATNLLTEVRNIRIEDYDTDSRGMLWVIELLARLNRSKGALQEAEKLGRQALVLAEENGDGDSPHVVTAMANLAITKRKRGQLEEAERLEERVLELRKKIMDENSPDVLTAMASLAITKGKRGQLEEAEQLEERVLELRKKITDENSPDVLTAMANLAITKGNRGQLEEAELLEERVVELRKKIMDENSPDVLTAMANLAITKGNRGQLEEAERLEELVLELRKKIMDENSPEVLTAMANLAITRRKRGQLEKAERLEERVVELRKKIMDENSPDVLTAMANLAITKGKRGQLEEAERLEECVLELRKKIMDEDSPDVLTAMANLAITKGKRGQLEEAERLEERVVELRKKIMDENSPDVLTAMANLAITRRRRGQLEEAEQLEERVLELRKKIMDENSPDVLTAMANLAITKGKRGQLEEAERLEECVLELRKKITDENSPDVLTAMANLAITRRKRGQLEEAEQLEERVLELRKKIMDEDSPDVLTAMASLAITKEKRGQLEEAELLEERVLELRKKTMDENSPYVLTAMANLAITKGNRGQLEEAERLEEHVLELRKKTMDENSPEVLTAMANLAITKGNRGRLEEAELLEERVVELRKKIMDENSPDVLTAMANLAITKGNRGQLDEALQIQLNILRCNEQVLGSDHQDTLSIMTQTAATYEAMGSYSEAEAMHTHVLRTVEKKFGQEHPNILDAMCNLAGTYDAQGRAHDACLLLWSVLHIRHRTLGQYHPYTINVMDQLAIGLTESHGEAEEMMTQVLEWRRQKLGADHLDTVRAQHRLAMIFMCQSRFEEAEGLLVEALSIRKKCLGPKHITTLDSKEMLGLCFCLGGDREKGIAILAEVLEVMEQIFGPNHPRSVALQGII